MHATLRTVLENHCSTSNTTNPASCDATALVMIKPKKNQRLVDPLLQSGFITRNYLSNGYSSSSGPKFWTELWIHQIFYLSSGSRQNAQLQNSNSGCQMKWWVVVRQAQMAVSIWDVYSHSLDRWVLSGTNAQAPCHSVLETVWLFCNEAQQVECLRGCTEVAVCKVVAPGPQPKRLSHLKSVACPTLLQGIWARSRRAGVCCCGWLLAHI